MKPSGLIVSTLLVAAAGGLAWSQQPEAGKEKPENKRAAWLHEAYLKDASEYEFFLDEGHRQKLDLRREPVMRWSSESDYNGDVYVWTHQGAAKVVGCIFSGPRDKTTNRAVMHEFHSLAPEPLYGDKRGTGWMPQEPGLKFEPIPDAPEPAATPSRRLIQMRDLARRFTSQVQRGGVRSEMRLLTQPIYRSEIADSAAPIIDGAVFTFVWSAGTDPETLLVIEPRKTQQGPRWFAAPARFTNNEAWVKLDNKEHWRAEPSPAGIFDGVTTKRYGAFQVKSITAPDLER